MDKYELVLDRFKRGFLASHPQIAECCQKTGKDWDGCHLECCGYSCEGDHCENCGPDI